MQVTLKLEIPDINTVIEGLQRVQDNAARVANVVRDQGNAELARMQAEAEAAEEAAKKAAEDASADKPAA